MKHVGSVFAVIVVLLALSPAAAQVTSQPPICFGFNENSLWSGFGPSVPVSSAGLTVHFPAPVTTAIDVIEVPVVFSWGGAPLLIELHQTSALGVPPTGLPLGTFTGGGLGGWVPFASPLPVRVVAGSTYAVIFKATLQPAPVTLCLTLQYAPVPATLLPYQFAGVQSCPYPFAASGFVGAIIRFRGLACGAGPLAMMASIGVACGSSITAGQTSLGASVLPAIGSTWPLQILSPGGGSAAIFWSVGTNPVGWTFSAASPCLCYLDQPSLAALQSLGLEPLTMGPLPVSSYATFNVAIPPDPVLLGVSFGLQALIVGPTGSIPLPGGLFGQTSNALQAVVGYWYP